jgi:Rab GTPase-binding effector protein 1
MDITLSISFREGFLATVTKSLKKVSHTVGHSSEKAEADNLEESMRKAQEDAEILRSVVEPLEEEIKCLKDKLRSAVAKLDEIEEEVGDHWHCLYCMRTFRGLV